MDVTPDTSKRRREGFRVTCTLNTHKEGLQNEKTTTKKTFPLLRKSCFYDSTRLVLDEVSEVNEQKSNFI